MERRVRFNGDGAAPASPVRRARLAGWGSPLLAATAAMLLLPTQAATPGRFDPSRPEDAIRLQQKLWCSLDDGVPALLWSQGAVYARIPGEPDRKLFHFQIWNARACANVSDPTRGPGYRSVSREIMLYIDPATGQLLRQWRNPFTGETVDVIHTQNDPVNMAAPQFAYDADGRPYRFEATFANGRVIASNEAPLFYDNPLGGPFQQYVGGRYHAMEMLNIFVYEQDLLDPKVRTLARWSRSWRRISGFLPWMRMGDRPGALVFTAVGQRVQSVEQLPEPIRSALRTEFAKYETPPPLDDTRPNETSWTYFKRVFTSQQQAGAGEALAAGSSAPKETAMNAPIASSPPVDTARRFAQDFERDCDARRPEAPVTTWWRGRVYSRRAGEKDRHLFDLRRTRVSRCEVLQADDSRGRGYRLLAKDSVDYFPAGSAGTGEPLATWRNPFTGEEVPVVGVRRGEAPILERWENLLSGAEQAAVAAPASPTRFVLSDKLLTGSDAHSVRTSSTSLGGAYPESAGPAEQYVLDTATSETPLASLSAQARPPGASAQRSRARGGAGNTAVTWGQVTPWFPWMRMGAREGEVVIHAAGIVVVDGP
jgi:hypothetical protein